MWLAMCRKHGWTPEVEKDGPLERLEARRVERRGNCSSISTRPNNAESGRDGRFAMLRWRTRLSMPKCSFESWITSGPLGHL
jgi:hypothetical protein